VKILSRQFPVVLWQPVIGPDITWNDVQKLAMVVLVMMMVAVTLTTRTICRFNL